MAISFDTATNCGATGWPSSSTNTLTWNHTVGVGSDKVLVVAMYTYSVAGLISTSSVAYGGNAMSKVNSIVGFADTLVQEVSLWSLANPKEGVNAVVATLSANSTYKTGLSMSYFGVWQLFPIDSSGIGQSASSGSGAAASLTVSTTVIGANCWLTGAAAARGGIPAGGTGTTTRAANANSYFAGGDSNGTVASGSRSLQWTTTSGAWPGGVICSLTPPLPATTVTNLASLTGVNSITL